MDDSNKPNPDDNSGERKSPPLGGGVIWYVLAFGVAMFFLLMFWQDKQAVEIPYGKLVELIEQSPLKHKSDTGTDVKGSQKEEEVEKPSQPSEDDSTEAAPEKPVADEDEPAVKQPAEPHIFVVEGKEDKQKKYRYWKLSKMKVGPTEITGSVTRQQVEPEKEEAKPNVKFHTPRLGLHNDNMWFFTLAKEHGFEDIEAEKAPSGWQTWLLPIMLMALVIVVFFMMMRRLGGPGSAMAFGRSRGKLYAQEDIGITFNDAAGIDEAVDELREVVDFLKTPEKYQRLGGHIPKGVLLVGPPGTGKTLLAKAVAGEACVPFFSISGSDFVEMFVGVGAARVRDMFQQAEAKAPCIVFIDELDALGKTRGSGIVGGHDEREQTLNALLVEMDGFGTNSGVIIMAATNRPETLDPALLRPGRFDRHVLVDRPDIRGREEILNVHIKDVKLDESVDLKKIAAITSGFVGADLASLVNEAALLAAREDKPAVTMQEFNEGVERVTTGLEKRQRVMHEDEKQRIAYHESAHALVAYSLPNTDPVHKVSIIPRGLAALGYTMQRPESDRYLMTQSELEARIQVLLAGTAAEEIVFEDVSTGAQNDLERATEIARSMVMEYGMSRLGQVNYRESGRSAFLGNNDEFPRERSHSEHTAHEIDEEIKHIIDRSIENVRHILQSRRKALVALAERLIKEEVIGTEQLKEIVEASSPSPMIVPGTSEVSNRAAETTEKTDEPEASPDKEASG